ncbi:hypothetical protein DFH06DRAFT_333031 [Mycena polygramma]|nr:hypothetical protein DFH06DRAFT_333031 [Mycena polygramma]
MDIDLQSIFPPPAPKIIPHDAQTVPPPPHIPEPPDYLFYGWVLEPELFGPGEITVVCDDGGIAKFKRPTTAMQAYDVFHFAAMLLQLMGGIRFEPPTNERPRIASLAVVAKDVPLHSHLDGADKIPSAAKLQKLEEMLHFVKKAEWIQSPRWSPRNEAWERKFDDSLTPLDFRKTYAEAQKAAEMASMYFGKQLHFPPIVGEDVPMPDATCSSKNPFESIFGPTPPRIIPHDAQTVPPPPHFPEPPECMFYGWVLEPELFGPGDITLSSDGATTKLKRPTTVMHAFDAFEFVAGVIGLGHSIRYESPTNTRPRIANFAEAVKGAGIRSRLNGADKIPSAAKLQKLEEILHVVKKPGWITTTRGPPPDEDSERAFHALVPPLDLSATYFATRPKDATFESTFPKPVIPPPVCEDVTMSDATHSHSTMDAVKWPHAVLPPPPCPRYRTLSSLLNP